jgi:hypothetical protein
VSSLRGETAALIPNGAFFASDPETGSLYVVGGVWVDGENGRRVGALVTHDNGTTWHDYTVSSSYFLQAGSGATLYAPGGARVVSPDGSIVGSVTEIRPNAPPSVVWAFRITPLPN